MSGIVGHTMYAILAGRAATQKKLPIASLFEQVVHRVPSLQELPDMTAPTWAELAACWRIRESG